MTIDESLKLIQNSADNFGKAFYAEFFTRYPEVTAHFQGVDMKRQELVLTMALTVIVNHYSHNTVAVDHYFEHLGEMHERRSIPPADYPKWSDCMMRVLERFVGVGWDEPLAAQWSDALSKASATLIQGYDNL